MSQINTAIGIQSFERVRDQIGAILADELLNQVDNYGLTEIKWREHSKVWIERFVAFDKTEVPAINVGLAPSNYANQSQPVTDGTYRFNIDIYTSAPTEGDKDGDNLAMVRAQRIMGVCRAILEDTRFKTLGFAPPFIENRHIESVGMGMNGTQDSSNQSFGRLVLVVRVPETNGMPTPALIKGYDTSVRLELSDKGYFYQGNNY